MLQECESLLHEQLHSTDFAVFTWHLKCPYKVVS